MRLLFDQNLSDRLPGRLSDLYPNSIHVKSISLDEAEDSTVWDYALAHGFTIVSKDSDFQMRSIIDGHPPKVIWIRSGNGSTNDIENILRQFHNATTDFSADTSSSLLAIP